MYSIRAILSKQPVAIAGALRSVLYVGVLVNLLQVDAAQLAGIALAAEAVLGLFAWASVTPNVTAAQNAALAYTAGRVDEAASAPSPFPNP